MTAVLLLAEACNRSLDSRRTCACVRVCVRGVCMSTKMCNSIPSSNGARLISLVLGQLQRVSRLKEVSSFTVFSSPIFSYLRTIFDHLVAHACVCSLDFARSFVGHVPLSRGHCSGCIVWGSVPQSPYNLSSSLLPGNVRFWNGGSWDIATFTMVCQPLAARTWLLEYAFGVFFSLSFHICIHFSLSVASRDWVLVRNLLMASGVCELRDGHTASVSHLQFVLIKLSCWPLLLWC